MAGHRCPSPPDGGAPSRVRLTVALRLLRESVTDRGSRRGPSFTLPLSPSSPLGVASVNRSAACTRRVRSASTRQSGRQCRCAVRDGRNGRPHPAQSRPAATPGACNRASGRLSPHLPFRRPQPGCRQVRDEFPTTGRSRGRSVPRMTFRAVQRVCNGFRETRPRTASICHSMKKPTPVFRGRLRSTSIPCSLRGWRPQSRGGSSPPFRTKLKRLHIKSLTIAGLVCHVGELPRYGRIEMRKRGPRTFVCSVGHDLCRFKRRPRKLFHIRGPRYTWYRYNGGRGRLWNVRSTT